jgi:hypothetical protein
MLVEIDSGDQLILAEALTLAAYILGRIPGQLRPNRNIEDMKSLADRLCDHATLLALGGTLDVRDDRMKGAV